MTSNKIKSLEEIKEELISRHTTKVKVPVVYNNIYPQNETIIKPNNDEEFVIQPIEIDWSTYDNWEDAADAADAANTEKNNQNTNKLRESIKEIESSFM